MIEKRNRVEERLRQGKTSLGFVCRTLSPAIVEMIGLSGFDFVWIDMEHTAADFSIVEQLCRAADAARIETLVRLPDKNPSNVVRALEAGAGIVNIPDVQDPAEVEALVKCARYFPHGQRGFCANSRGNLYGFGGGVSDTFAAANERVMTMIQIESARGIEKVAEICAVPGLDIVFVGLADLSQSLGIPGNLDHPDLLEGARRVLREAKVNGKTTAMLAEDPAAAARWVSEGVSMICCGVDITSIGKMLRATRRGFEAISE
jgi:4-hydroxy-2-oxoheptanedioate aldolase